MLDNMVVNLCLVCRHLAALVMRNVLTVGQVAVDHNAMLVAQATKLMVLPPALNAKVLARLVQAQLFIAPAAFPVIFFQLLVLAKLSNRLVRNLLLLLVQAPHITATILKCAGIAP